jgi:hypothetical protein
MKVASSQPPYSGLSARFDHLLAARWKFSRSASRVTVPSDLPPPLALTVLHLREDQEWRAYSSDFRTYCAIGRSGDRSADSFAPLLQVCFLDSDASVYAAGLWHHDRERGWEVHDVYEIDPTTYRREFYLARLH